MNLGEKLKQRKPKELIVELDGDKYLVRGIGRVEKNKLMSACAKKDKIDWDQVESTALARCVLDPKTEQPVLPNKEDWDIAADAAAPLVDAAIKVCGFDSSEVGRTVKNSDTTGSSG